MKSITKMFILFVMIFTITGCGNHESSNNQSSNNQSSNNQSSDNQSGHSRVSRGNSVDKVMDAQMSRANPAGSGAGADYSEPEEKQSAEGLPGEKQRADNLPGEKQRADNLPQEKQGADAYPETSEEPDTQTADNVDYDLTAMSSDMVYAMVYQMMADPYTYVGKSFRMNGLYYSVYHEPTAQYYHYCIIQDALACCAQGMEFQCDGGTYNFPEDYPEENTEIVVQGIFETYQEEGDSNLYCRLNDAALIVEDN